MMMMRLRVYRYFSTSNIQKGVVLDAREGLSNRDVISQLRSALINDGYFYVRDIPELSRDYIKMVYDFAQKAHELPVEIKKKYAVAGTYVGPDVDQLELSYDGKTQSVARAWEFSRHKFTLASSEPSYPQELNYEATLDELYRRQDALGKEISIAMAKALELSDVHFFVDKTGGDSFSTIRLLRYPGYDESSWTAANSNSGDHSWTYYDDDDQTGIAPHTDFELFTVMHWDSPGLEILTRDTQSWIKPHTTFESDSSDNPVFLIICGDCLERFTNGLVRATPHRVLQTPHDRMSIIRFHALDPSAIVEPLPQFGSPKHSPVTMEKHMRTTMRNIADGIPSWNTKDNTSVSAAFVYDSTLLIMLCFLK